MIISKEEAIALVQTDGMKLRVVPKELKDDIDVVMTAILNNPHAFQFSSERLQENSELSVLVEKDDDYYFSIVDERSGYRFDIPLLMENAPDYFEMYVYHMRGRERNPGTFQRTLNWD